MSLYDRVSSYRITSVTGEPFMGFESDGTIVYLPYDTAIANPLAVKEAFRRRGVHFIGKDGEEQIRRGMSSQDQTPDILLIDRLGWNKTIFVRPNGEIFGTRKHDATTIIPDIEVSSCSAVGTLSHWQSSIASPVHNDCIPAMAILAQFAAPLVSLVECKPILAFEIVEGSGNSIGCLQSLMTSVTGGMGSRVGQRYAVTFSDLVADPRSTITARADSSMIIDGHSTYMMGLTAGKRLEAVKTLLGLDREGVCSSYVLTGRDALINLTDEEDALEQFVQERLITVTLEPTRRFGVFDFQSRNRKGNAERSADVIRAATFANGTAMPAFIAGLTRALQENESVVRGTIEQDVCRFVEKMKPDGNDINAMRAANAFGLLYAAGRLAKSFGILPADWVCGTLMQRAYRLQQKAKAGRQTFDDQLLSLAKAQGTLKIDRQKERPSTQAIENADVFLLTNGSIREIAVRRHAIHDVFRDWSRIRRKKEVQVRVNSDDHATAPRVLVKGSKPERLFCFQLPKRRI